MNYRACARWRDELPPFGAWRYFEAQSGRFNSGKGAALSYMLNRFISTKILMLAISRMAMISLAAQPVIDKMG
jgi:hypothetical protein